MRKVLLSPRFLGLHLFVVAAVLVMLRLGLWQWHRAMSPSGGIQNYAYAFQWPLFAVFAVVLWWKTMRIEASGGRQLGTPGTPSGRDLPDPAISHAPGVRIGITAAPVPDDVSGLADAEDDEVRLYNAYLARLNARQGSR